MLINPENFQYLVIRASPENLTSTINFIKKAWENIVPGNPFDYSFFDQHFDKIYKNDQRTGKIFGFFSSFAIFIACLGLFGLGSIHSGTKNKGNRGA